MSECKMKCSVCSGRGWYGTHASPSTHLPGGDCSGFCPIEIQCEACCGTGEADLLGQQGKEGGVR